METTHANDIADDEEASRPGRMMLGWAFGPAVLAGHLGLFLATGMSLLTIDLLRSPGVVTVTGPLQRWALVVAVHALVAAVGWAVTQVIAAARAAEPGADVDETFWPAPEPAPEPAPVAVAAAAGIDWSDHIAQPAPAAAMPGTRLAAHRPLPLPNRAPGDSLASDDVVAEAESAVLERGPVEYMPPTPAPPEAPVLAGAPPSGRFAPAATPVPVPEPDEERKPRWFDRQRRKPAEQADAPESVERTPPGWRVISSDTVADPAAPIPPPAVSARGDGDDDSWTWIEAAAQAWLEHRAAATGTTGRPGPTDEAAPSPPATRSPEGDDGD